MAMKFPVSSIVDGSPGSSGGDTMTVSISARAASRTSVPSSASSALRSSATRSA